MDLGALALYVIVGMFALLFVVLIFAGGYAIIRWVRIKFPKPVRRYDLTEEQQQKLSRKVFGDVQRLQAQAQQEALNKATT